ncbi:hypothetical protein [Burkholderia stagnalis]|uniref:hypothetical protein n=1 Tax=Burkholderia stagnalis TaxID=1503054 RepID=UPI000751CB79|nr:hypothetical protein [Burkholderia stagnalis]KVX62712.1 hypothetical protein WT33_15640 [Burkholderia stagnalis]
MRNPDVDASVWEFFDERAAIMQYEGGKPRHDADFCAYVRTRLYFEARGVSLPHSGYFAPFSMAELGWSDATAGVIVFPCAAVLAGMAATALDEANRAGHFYTCLTRPRRAR